jgi:hypothetical protein
MNGHFETVAGIHGLNSLRGDKKGRTTLTLKDGTKYDFRAPTLVVDGLLYGERTANIDNR